MLRKTCFYLQILAYGMLIDLSFAINGFNVRNLPRNKFLYVVSLSKRAPNEPRGELSNDNEFLFESRHLCTGALISRRNVLTIAHCLLRRQISEIVIVAGSTNLLHGQKYYPESWITYDEWKYGRINENPNDNIGIVTLEGDGINNPAITPTPVSFGLTESLYHKKIKLAGFGVSESRSRIRFMRSGVLEVISNEECIERASLLLNKRFNLPANYFCSYAVPWALSSLGDAGAPLINKTHGLVGLNIGTCPNLQEPRYTREFIHENQMNCHLRLPHYQEFISDVIQE